MRTLGKTLSGYPRSARSLRTRSSRTTTTRSSPRGPSSAPSSRARDPNAPVGAAVTAIDADGSNTLTYQLKGFSGSGYFTIDSTGSTAGQIRVAPGVTLDHERHPTVDLRVTATDPVGAEAYADVTVTIEDVNEAPQAFSNSVLIPEDEPTPIRVLDNDTDPDGDDLTVNIVRQPANGTVTVVDLAIPGERPTVTYTPRANFHGDDSFTYKARDTGSPSLLSSETIVAIVVRSVNDPPTFLESIPTRLVSKRTAGRRPRRRARDRHGHRRGGQSLVQPRRRGRGPLQDRSGQRSDHGGHGHHLRCRHEATYTFEVEATDDGRPPAKATVDVIITVIDVNEPPNAVADAATTPEDTQVTIRVLDNDRDPDDDDLTVNIVRQPANGTVTVVDPRSPLPPSPTSLERTSTATTASPTRPVTWATSSRPRPRSP